MTNSIFSGYNEIIDHLTLDCLYAVDTVGTLLGPDDPVGGGQVHVFDTWTKMGLGVNKYSTLIKHSVTACTGIGTYYTAKNRRMFKLFGTTEKLLNFKS